MRAHESYFCGTACPKNGIVEKHQRSSSKNKNDHIGFASKQKKKELLSFAEK